jgi:hypothetical protein
MRGTLQMCAAGVGKGAEGAVPTCFFQRGSSKSRGHASLRSALPTLVLARIITVNRSVRNDPAQVATWAGSPIVGSEPIAAFEG